MQENEKLLEVKDLRISFRTNSGTVKAVRGISFDLYKGKTLAIVGESGSGKSVTSRAILGILANNKIVEGGQILYDGKDLLALKEEQFTHIRGSKISMIFQDPLSSLNPIMKVGKQLTEPMFLKAKASRREAKKYLKSNIKAERHERKLLNLTDLLNLKKIGEDAYIFEKHNKYIRDDINYDLLNTIIFEELKDNEINNQYNEFSKLVNEYLNIKESSNKENCEEYLSKVKTIHDIGLNLEKLLNRYKRINKNNFDENKKQLFKKFSHFNKKFYLNEYHTLLIKKEVIGDELVNKYKDTLSKLLESNYNTSFDNLSKLLNKLEQYKNDNFNDIKTFNYKKALKELKIISLYIRLSSYDFGIEKDDILEVYPISLKNYIKQYLESIKLVKQRQRLLNSFVDENNNVKPIPSKVKAGERETILKPEEFFEVMKSYTDEIILYICEKLKNTNFDTKDYFIKYVNNFKLQYVKSKTKVLHKEAKKKAISLLKSVGIQDAERRFKQYPFEFSGGMRQRIVIAIALSSNPEILICDEPTTALDVTIQAQILELINDLKKKMNLSIIFITHDLGVVANMADDIAVMYAGKIVEFGSVYDIFYDPRHPYTWALLGSMPDLNTKEKLEAIPGTPPNMLLPPRGDAFAPRNKYAMKIDFEMQPPFYKISQTHQAATWLLDKKAPQVKAPKVVRDRIYRSLKLHPENIPTYTLEKNSILGGFKDGK